MSEAFNALHSAFPHGLTDCESLVMGISFLVWLSLHSASHAIKTYRDLFGGKRGPKRD
jgi:hypothetical protein